MAEDKKTQLGTIDPVPRANRATGAQTAQPSVATPAATPAPSTTPAPHAHQTSYLPPSAPQVDPLINAMIAGRYHITRKLGEGGMGAVYLATHTLLEKQVALKVLHAEFARKSDLVERFMQEAKAASRIRHENVIDISDFGATPEGQVFFAMELLKGHDLHEEVARARLGGTLLPWSRTKKIFLQICSALQAAHDKGIIHRDLKPENIYLVDFLGEPDFVKLLDFGIAKLTEVAEGDRKLTRTGMLFGTPEYMSPEQARGEAVDLRVDVYAMGCILFQLLTGRVPFEAENFMGVLSLHLTETPPQVSIDVLDRVGAPRELVGIIDKALAKNRNDRWQTISEMANAIRTACGDPIPQPGQSTVMPSVAAPATTTTRPGQTGQVAAVTPGPTTQKRTQWTGSLNIPQEPVDGEKKPGSKLPLFIGLGVVLAGGIVAAVIAMSKKSTPPVDPGTSSGSGSGSAIAAAPPDAAIAAVTPDAAPPPPELPPLPAKVEIHLDSKPGGADVFENGRLVGKTPIGFKTSGSRNARQFVFKKSGYSDLVVEIVPDQPMINDVETLVKGAAGTVVKKPANVGGGSGSAATVKPPEVPSVTIDAGVPQIKPPEAPVDAAVKVAPPDDDCGDPPCLKQMPKDTPKEPASTPPTTTPTP